MFYWSNFRKIVFLLEELVKFILVFVLMDIIFLLSSELIFHIPYSIWQDGLALLITVLILGLSYRGREIKRSKTAKIWLEDIGGGITAAISKNYSSLKADMETAKMQEQKRWPFSRKRKHVVRQFVKQNTLQNGEFRFFNSKEGVKYLEKALQHYENNYR